MKLMKKYKIWGFKKFHIAQGTYERGDFLFYAKGGIKRFFADTRKFIQN